MTIKLLIVDPEIGFAIPVKRALEQSGDYTVNVFANGMAAVELCQRVPQDIAILDFRIGDMDLPRLIKALRAAQPDLYILTSPRTIDDVVQQPTLDAQGSISKPYFARQLGPIITEALATKAKQAAKTQGAPPDSIPEPINDVPATLPEPPVEPDDTFHRLTATGKSQPVNTVAINEPDIDDEATIRELVSGQSTPVSAAPATIPEEADLSESTVATVALGAASDDNVMLEDIALPRFIDRLELEMGDTAASRPVPAWAEPAASFEDTQPSERLRVALMVPPITGDTEPTGAVSVPDQPVEVEDQAPEPPDSELIEPADDSIEPEVIDSDDEALEPDFATPETIQPEEVPVASQPPVAPSVATLAVQLTQLSVDLASDATLVTQGDTLIASAGDLPPIALAGVVDTINTTWQDSDEQASSLVRFIHVPGLGDYLLYSTPTADDMILSMLFPAETPLKVIRKQAKELISALENVPDQAEFEADRTLISRPTDPFPPQGLREAIAAAADDEGEPAEEASPEEDETPTEQNPPRAEGPYTAYAFVWLPRHEPLDADLAATLLDWILSIATAHSWQLESTDIQPNYVTVQVSIPATETPTATVETLMQETSAHAEHDDLWADAYYIVAPGRPVTEQEIASFMEYRRDAVDAA